MNALLARLLRASRLRVLARVLAFALPAGIAATALAARLGGAPWSWAVLALCFVASALAVVTALRRIDTAWLARRLDARDPRMEDSAALLFADPAHCSPLQQLQRQRLEQRLQHATPPGLRPPWPTRAFITCGVLAIAVVAATALWPQRVAAPAAQRVQLQATAMPSRPGHTQVTGVRLDIAPPGYTRLPAHGENGFEAKVPEGAQVRWTLQLSPAPASAALAFHDGRRVPLVREGDRWIASRRIDKPLLYRIVLDDAPPLHPDRLYRIGAVADQPPQVRGIAPEDTLTLRREGQRAWTVSFEAEDDYGLAASAPLRITLAQGEGESIRFEERSLTLAGTGDATRRRYAHSFDLGALGLTPGSDFVVQLAVTDNRAAGPQTTRSASYILRWPPPEATETSGLDGLVKKALPAYFRSQRQIIIDSEALIAQRSKLSTDKFLERSDGIGVDQRLLRLRYGQFLGEESEGSPKRALPIAEEEDHAPAQPLLPTADAQDEADAARAQAQTQKPQDEHDHGESATAPAFGEAGDVLSEFGHTHDDAEAATLLDPETRRTLKAALDQMWQAELHLRQGRPDQALPFEYKALDYIKQVQQADRVYLARVGSELPPIDESRRLSGERANLAPRDDFLTATPSSPPLETLWRALEVPPGRDAPALDLDGVERWLRANERRVPDALGVIAAIDGVRNDAECVPCRETLRSRLWPLLRRPPAPPTPRAKPDRGGQAYLEALQEQAR
ncbi:hypothetical protein ACFPN1_04130 [Lysobacter yangpyeongensis]|uniref:DUF4175 domain-containing protein n=1 Tax=Lysobacter yangpyeongensis TaxID=346182 RepID=A0ABW0SJR8_9GAMM